MSLSRALALFLVKKKLSAAVLTCHSRRCYYPDDIKPPKHVSLQQQSVLLPGKERIRASCYLDDPNVLTQTIERSPEIRTVYDLLQQGLKISGDGDCMGSKSAENGEYKYLRYSEVISKSQHIGSGFIKLGLKPCNDTCVGICGDNREEFLLSVYACAAYSMVSVPLHMSLALKNLIFIIEQASLPLVVVNSVEKASEFLDYVPQLPSLRKIVMMDVPSSSLLQTAKEKGIHLVHFAELEELGKKHVKDLVLPLPEDLFCIPYTSGTTGTPKGVMLTHANVIAYVGTTTVSYGEANHYGGTIISYLPPAHIYEILNNVVTLYNARRIAFYRDDIKKLMDEVRVLKPTILPLVPKLMNAVYLKAMESVKGNVFKSLLLKMALWRKEELLKKGHVTCKSIWDRLVFRKFREILGGEVLAISTSSAPASNEVTRFFKLASGAYVFEAYGQTEILGAVKTLALECNGGHVGAPLPNNHVKLVDVPEMGYFAKDDIGEVCVKGSTVFKGYFQNEKATKECLIDGWQHTGDIGKWLPNGTLKLIDRKKNLFKLSQGEYISPEKVENIYSQSPLVLQVFVEGFSDQSYTIALIVPDPAVLKKWLESKGYEKSDLSQKDLRKDFLLELRTIGKKEELNSLEQARSIGFLSEPFSVQNDMMTPTFKLKRFQARKRYQQLFRELYAEGPLL